MNTHCLDCHSEIEYHMTWNSFLFTPKERWLCGKCESQLQSITGERCRTCSRPLSLLEPHHIKEGICLDCTRWERDPQWSGVLTKNTSLLLYNEYLKSYLARFKYRGDYILAKAFSASIKEAASAMNTSLIVPIPLSPERLQERGFNQSEAIAKEAGLQTQHLLIRKHSEKQSKKSRQERIHSETVFDLSPDQPNITNQSILLIDDIYTTGTTLRHAAQCLKQAGAKQVSSLTLARG
ncbi:ComF family protein [Rossellomorea vietnamensis]|uniref:ComF family protein n=1 Tax=Rossellomorea vietnamensis TaxID=218284 RepID=A0A5D4KFQ2_9BACI|nr:ComF family protein [Rossellomorea vietnamensis]TYR76042.1 ComF family protein [Rossellomorea vietnamensis]